MEVLGADTFGAHQEVLIFRSGLPVPECVHETDVVIRVAYTELNPVDLQKLQAKPGQPVPAVPFVPGYGGSGIVEQVGPKVPPHLAVGTRVAILGDPSRPGSYASHVVLHYHLVKGLPSGLGLKDAATAPLSGCTAYESLIKLGLISHSSSFQTSQQLPEDAKLLIVGGAGGVGSWAISLAKACHPSLHIIATASSPESEAWCRQRGAHQVISHDKIAETLGGGHSGSVNYVLCLTEPTPALFGMLAELIRPYGTICLVVAGSSIKSLDLGFCFFKGANIVLETVFSSIRTKFAQMKPDEHMNHLLDLLASRDITAPLSPQLEQISEDWKDALKTDGLLDLLATGHVQGKLVMKVGPDDML